MFALKYMMQAHSVCKAVGCATARPFIQALADVTQGRIPYLMLHNNYNTYLFMVLLIIV
jgi:hypothetical protein